MRRTYSRFSAMPTRCATRSRSPISACRRHIAGHECQRRKLGFGPWSVLDKASGRIIGFGGLYDDPFDPGWGYHFARSAWSRGFATELTRFSIALAHGPLRLAEVRAFAHRDNVASRRVLAKTGFVEQRFMPEMNRYLYAHHGASA